MLLLALPPSGSAAPSLGLISVFLMVSPSPSISLLSLEELNLGTNAHLAEMLQKVMEARDACMTKARNITADSSDH